MWKILRGSSGFTLPEILVGMVILVTVVAGIGILVSQSISSIQTNRVKSQLVVQSRTAMETMTPILQRGIPDSRFIGTCGSSPCIPGCVPPIAEPTPPPLSCIEFNTLDNIGAGGVAISTYTFFWSNNTAQMLANLASSAGPHTVGPTVLASNVTGLSFIGNSTDLAVMGVTLALQAPSSATRMESVVLPNVMVQMTGSGQ